MDARFNGCNKSFFELYKNWKEKQNNIKDSYTQVINSLSFTLFYKGHSICVGPERASRNLQSSPLKLIQRRTLEIPLKEFIAKIEYYLQKTQNNVHNNPPTTRSLLTLNFEHSAQKAV